MRTVRNTLTMLAVAVAAVVGWQTLNPPATRAAPPQTSLKVEEQNLDLAGRIQVSLPNVDENGRLLVVGPPQEQPEPVQGSEILSLSTLEFRECQILFPIPEGRRLTLEHVSVQGYIVGDSNVATAAVTAGITMSIPMSSTFTQGDTEPTTPESPVYVYWAGTENVQAFRLQGNLTACAYVRERAIDPSDNAFFSFNWSGHLD